jgi:hypothetical protein
MDVTNSSGEDSQYRTTSGTTKEVNWKVLKNQAVLQCSDPKVPWTIHFQLQDGTTLQATYDRPMASVVLIKDQTGYRIFACPKPVESPAAKPTRMPPPQPPKVGKTKNAA